MKEHPELKVISEKPSVPTPEPKPLIPKVKKTIVVASGKGGVGKSTVAVNLSVALSQLHQKVGLMDADVYGPSIPTMMGINEEPKITKEQKIIPLKRHGISMMSIGFLVPEEQALIWRGPMLHKAIRQFLGDVVWGNLDYLVIDLPPGTGDVQLSLSQTIPIGSAIIVTTPQDVALADVRRAIGMCERMKVPIAGLVENMSIFVCPHCRGESEIFRPEGSKAISDKLGIPLLGQIPIDPQICECGDAGKPITVKFPDSPQSMAFRKTAEKIISTRTEEAR